MNNEVSKLLEQLAQKMGTTVEYLWQILIYQAHIQAITVVIQIVIIMIASYLLVKLHIRFSKEPEDDHSIYYKYQESATVPMVLSALIMGVLIIIAFFCISDVINGFFNPQYWALQKVLNTVN